jgi:hypothetical protein
MSGGGQDELTDGLIPRSAQYIFDALCMDLNASSVSDGAMMSTAVPFETPPSPKASARGVGKRGSQSTVAPGNARKKPSTSQAKAPISSQHPGGSKSKPKPKTKVLCTFCEVYNEQVYDLLNLSEETLPVRWDAKRKAFTVPSLLTVECNTVEEFMMVVREGEMKSKLPVLRI